MAGPKARRLGSRHLRTFRRGIDVALRDLKGDVRAPVRRRNAPLT